MEVALGNVVMRMAFKEGGDPWRISLESQLAVLCGEFTRGFSWAIQPGTIHCGTASVAKP
ncbi:unnamed protein product [Cladocopium goreaui]|uniref:Uncharacterized protein n=1 Tax=Cladocopium goreaui TaxID=2562237 RepID=A0A9P1BUR2_9DINO|nr:unnamed protein product [Cladocopium goreaui]